MEWSTWIVINGGFKFFSFTICTTFGVYCEEVWKEKAYCEY